MEQYIPKAAVVAEIKRRIKTNKECMLGLRNLDYYQGKVDALNDTISFLNTIEVKEVDLEKEISRYCEKIWPYEEVDEDIIAFARHFFELGIKTQKGK